jgi:hypothetical protein
MDSFDGYIGEYTEGTKVLIIKHNRLTYALLFKCNPKGWQLYWNSFLSLFAKKITVIPDQNIRSQTVWFKKEDK